MTTNAAKSKAGIVRGLPYLGALVALFAVGCGAEASTDPLAEQTDDLRRGHGHHWGPKLCRSADGSECGADQLCLPLLSRSCPGPKHIGICAPKPHTCPDISDPVCGCDGKTYDNLCEAAAARTAITHAGACAPTSGCGANGVCPGSGTCVGGGSNDDGEHRHSCGWGHHHTTPSGTCQCTVVEQCARGQIWNSDPAVCACVDDPAQQDPCARVQCPTGMACVVQSDGSVACQ
jgi:hypothetical protein